MPRRARIRIPGMPLHIVQRGHNRSNCFHAETDRLYYLRLVGKLAGSNRCSVHAYVLMTNHVHLLVTADQPEDVSGFMKQTAQAYAQFVNRTYGHSGSPWEGRFRSSVVQSEEYLLACYRYIELNPVRAGLVIRPEDYRWSSYRSNALGAISPVIIPHDAYLRLGGSPHERQAAYRGLFGEFGDQPEFAAIRRAILGGFAVGREAFVQQIERSAGRPACPQKAGRPRKAKSGSVPNF